MDLRAQASSGGQESRCIRVIQQQPFRIKIAGRNINNLIYADDTTLMA